MAELEIEGVLDDAAVVDTGPDALELDGCAMLDNGAVADAELDDKTPAAVELDPTAAELMAAELDA